MIGLAISTHNRYEVFKKTLTEIKKYTPKNFKLVIVDDASDVPVKEATFRFKENVGIATSKNKCFELLDDCEHIFLFDDDCYPIVRDWWKPYVEHSEPHLQYQFIKPKGSKMNDLKELYKDSKIRGFSHSRGCMLYYNHVCLETVGGMDTRYSKWGFEHVDLSNRIYNSGLTKFRYQDIPNSQGMFFSHDEEQSVRSTYSDIERRSFLDSTRDRFNASFTSTEYCPYINNEIIIEDKAKNNNIILTCFLTGAVDTQRGRRWEADITKLQPLQESCKNNNLKLVVLHDCFDMDNDEFPKVEAPIEPYFNRWLIYREYLQKHPEIDNVWCVDGTDVEVLKNPFVEMAEDKIYVGCEPSTLQNRCLIQNNTNVKNVMQFIRLNRNKTLLNAGLLGGSRKDVLTVCFKILQFYFDIQCQAGTGGDMGLFNYILYGHFGSQIIYGSQVNTEFKKFETENKVAWFRHK